VEGGVGAAGWGGMEVGTGESEAGGGDVGNLFMRSTVWKERICHVAT